MTLNQIIELDIIDMTDEGGAIAKIDNITVFLDKGVIGDKVLAKIKKIKKNYVQADVKKIIEKSTLRNEQQLCEIQDVCGGCQILDIRYEKQLEIKKNLVIQKLKRIGNIENPNVKDIIYMDNPFRYRNKVQIPVGKINGETKIGFYKQKSHDIVPFFDCKIQDKINNDIIDIIKQYIKKNNISIYDEKTHKGELRHIVTKISKSTNEIMLILVTNSEITLNVEYILEKIKEKNIPICSIIQNINIKKTNVILSNNNIILHGKNYIVDTIDSLSFRIYPNSFYQVNTIQMNKMYKKVMDYADISINDTIYDLYCGIGTMSLLFSKKAKQVYGIEVVKEAIQSANENASINKISNAHFICGKVEDEIENLINKSNKPDIVVLDPARKGCEETVLNTILKSLPRKIIYVSCNPATLARDLSILLKNKEYTLDEITPFDLFCHTMHVECVVLMSRVAPNK